MNFKLEKNDNKKIVIILTSIIFCVLILVIGTTTAFFNQGENKSLENIVNVDLTNTLKYTSGASTYMRGNLIPVVEEDVELFAMKNSENNFTDDDICRFEGELNACSLYEFTIKNTATVTQKINATLTPNPNTFANLYYMIYEGKQDSLTSDSKVVKLKTHIDSTNTSNMFEEVLLTPGQEKTYTVVFYIKSTDYDQTSTDLNKRFGAIISVNSITTGYNITMNYGDNCYDVEKINGGEYDGQFKLTKFYGIDHDKKTADTDCGVTKDETTGLYTVVVPSEIGDDNIPITVLGHELFTGLKIDVVDGAPQFILNEYSKINNIEISEGIEIIDGIPFDENMLTVSGTFMGVGVKEIGANPIYYDGVDVKLPTTLKKIGTSAFMFCGLKNIDIPDNVNTIGAAAFMMNKLNSLEIPASVETIEINTFYENDLSNILFKKNNDGRSSLKIIGEQAFAHNNITNLDIPDSVKTIRRNAFSYNKLTSIEIPPSVQTIGESAFEANYLITVIFKLDEYNKSQLTTIGNEAFNGTGYSSGDETYRNNLTYPIGSPLFIPSSVTYIGDNAFNYNSNLKEIKYSGTLAYSGANWHGDAAIVE